MFCVCGFAKVDEGKMTLVVTAEVSLMLVYCDNVFVLYYDSFR
jgi:hypothetical protein